MTRSSTVFSPRPKPDGSFADDEADAPRETVILLHGWGRTSFSMRRIEKYLQGRGYGTYNLGYPTLSEPIDALADKYLERAVSACLAGNSPRIHFVAHSLGGIVVRCYLQNRHPPPGGRLVMLSPPNRGTEVVDFLARMPWLPRLAGPAGRALGTGPESLPRRLKPVGLEIGVIAGDRSINPLFSALIRGPDDGTVSVENTKLEEMKDFLIIPCSHTFIMRSLLAARQAAHFLESGHFDRGPIARGPAG
ncbi:MAG: alpha/beta hydrolase [Thermodesulfobacteriota bacterium]